MLVKNRVQTEHRQIVLINHCISTCYNPNSVPSLWNIMINPWNSMGYSVNHCPFNPSLIHARAIPLKSLESPF